MPNIPSPKSRLNKKQLAANLPPDLVERVRYYCRRENLTQTEVMAMAVNAVAEKLEMGAILRVYRERVMRREKGKAQVHETGPKCRVNTTRIAAHFPDTELERLKSFAKEKGKSLNGLIEDGMRLLVSGVTLPAKTVEQIAASGQTLQAA